MSACVVCAESCTFYARVNWTICRRQLTRSSPLSQSGVSACATVKNHVSASEHVVTDYSAGQCVTHCSRHMSPVSRYRFECRKMITRPSTTDVTDLIVLSVGQRRQFALSVDAHQTACKDWSRSMKVGPWWSSGLRHSSPSGLIQLAHNLIPLFTVWLAGICPHFNCLSTNCLIPLYSSTQWTCLTPSS